MSIRRARLGRVSLDDLVGNGTMTAEVAALPLAAVAARKNIMIAGATNAGKTTLLRALANEIPPHERLITVERALELGLGEFEDLHPNVVAFEERLPNSEGLGGVSMAELVRRSLRMNPSRVIVGEVLGDEIVTMLNAMSQGNDGSLSTIHANSSIEVFNRISTYAIQSAERLPIEATQMLIAGAIDFVVFVRKRNDYDDGGGLSRVRREHPRGHRRRRPGAVQRGLRAGRRRPRRARTRRSACIDELEHVGYQPEVHGPVGVTGAAMPLARPARAPSSAAASAARPRGASDRAATRPAKPPAVPARGRASASRHAPLVRGIGVGVLIVLVVTRWVVAGAWRSALLVAFWRPRLRRRRRGTLGDRPARGAGHLDRVAARHDRRRGRPRAGDPGDRRRTPAPAIRPALEPAGRPAADPRAAALALLRFADDLDDPSADLIVAALVLNARLRGPGLRDVLTALADSAREELDMRRRVEASRAAPGAACRSSCVIVLSVMGG